ncbi:MAG: ABC transporter ATP-binding protein, partial [Albidovulum sp.]
MAEIIKIENVTKTFGKVVGVNDISLSVEEGEFVTLLGPSGCGKSTLLRMIGGFEEPTKGRIWLAGQDVTDLPPSKRAVNMVFQDYALFPHLSVGKN